MINVEAPTNWTKRIDYELNSKLRESIRFHGGIDVTTYRFASPDAQQSLADKLFSSRDMSSGNYWGNCYSEIDSKYFGITLKLKPVDYLCLALEREKGKLDSETAFSDIKRHITDKVNNKESVRLGVPYLRIEIDEENKRLIVVGHEGRHRADAIRAMLPKSYIPVDLNFTNEIRRRDINYEILDYELVNQDGYAMRETFRDMLPDNLKDQFLLGIKTKNLENSSIEKEEKLSDIPYREELITQTQINTQG